MVSHEPHSKKKKDLKLYKDQIDLGIYINIYVYTTNYTFSMTLIHLRKLIDFCRSRTEHLLCHSMVFGNQNLSPVKCLTKGDLNIDKAKRCQP